MFVVIGTSLFLETLSRNSDMQRLEALGWISPIRQDVVVCDLFAFIFLVACMNFWLC